MRSIYLLTFLFLFLQWPSFSKVIENKAISLSREIYPFKTVCGDMGFKDSLIEQAVGNSKIDCTSRVVNILDFCKKKTSKRQNLIRGRVDALTKNNVVCEFAKSVVLKIDCSGDSFKCTNRKRLDCENLKKAFAYSLVLTHSAYDSRVLTCIYSDDGPLKL
ncbi:hypothetical protein [Halobacteriovorax marinus]|uniref:hypothetical protein n=1 Tax=Halobacteriovorax marinus TaxID=97084 RepID=UPI003A934E94